MKINKTLGLLVAGVLVFTALGVAINFFNTIMLIQRVDLLEKMVTENTLDIYRGVK